MEDFDISDYIDDNESTPPEVRRIHISDSTCTSCES